MCITPVRIKLPFLGGCRDVECDLETALSALSLTFGSSHAVKTASNCETDFARNFLHEGLGWLIQSIAFLVNILFP